MSQPPPGHVPATPPWRSMNDAGVVALVTGILSFVLCPVMAAPAMIYGKKSQEAQARGLADNGSLGAVGYWLGLASIIVWVAVIALMAVMYALMGALIFSTSGFAPN